MTTGMMGRNRPGAPVTISLVIPVFNEQCAIDPFLEEVEQYLREDDYQLELVFVDDGSTDGTLAALLLRQQQDVRIRVVELTRNFGKEAALTAGLAAATGDAVIPIDVDLQDPVSLIPEMVRKWREGYDVVLARRTDRAADSWIKRFTAEHFYKVHNQLSDRPIPENVGDFRLMDRSVVAALNALPETRRFMKGLLSWVGYRTGFVDYVRPERVAGYSKFNGWKLWNLAIEGITSFSTAPLRIWTYIGLSAAFLSLLFAIFILITVVISGVDVPGYASIIIAITFIGSLQLVGIGMLGEYLGRTYLESKRRPIYLIRAIHEPHGMEPDGAPAGTRVIEASSRG